MGNNNIFPKVTANIIGNGQDKLDPDYNSRKPYKFFLRNTLIPTKPNIIKQLNQIRKRHPVILHLFFERNEKARLPDESEKKLFKLFKKTNPYYMAKLNLKGRLGKRMKESCQGSHMKAFKSLKLDFLYYEQAEDWKIFGKNLRRFIFLRELSLVLYQSCCIKEIYKSLHCLKSLTRLNLILDSWGHEKMKTLDAFFICLSKLKPLNHFSFSLEACFPLEIGAFKALSNAIRNQDNLLSLNLRFCPGNNICKNKGDLILQMLNGLKKLSCFSFELMQNTSIESEVMIKLLNILGSVQSLSHLKLNICPTNSNDAFEDIFEDSLIHFSQLKSFHIQIGCLTKWMSQHFTRLSSSLPNLQQLIDLNLDFRSCRQLTDHELKVLSQSLKSKTELKALSLQFAWCIQITKKEFTNLIDSIKYLTHLSKLELDFSNSYSVQEKTLKEISEVFPYLKNLTSCTLKFFNCPNITDKGIEYICQSLRSKKDLFSLEMDFCMKKFQTFASVRSVIQLLHHLPKLTSLKMDHLDEFYNKYPIEFQEEFDFALKDRSIMSFICTQHFLFEI